VVFSRTHYRSYPEPSLEIPRTMYFSSSSTTWADIPAEKVKNVVHLDGPILPLTSIRKINIHVLRKTFNWTSMSPHAIAKELMNVRLIHRSKRTILIRLFSLTCAECGSLLFPKDIAQLLRTADRDHRGYQVRHHLLRTLHCTNRVPLQLAQLFSLSFHVIWWEFGGEWV
jgi:hypothetical protein